MGVEVVLGRGVDGHGEAAGPARFTAAQRARIPREIRRELARLRTTDDAHGALYVLEDWLVVAGSIAAVLASATNPAVYAVAVVLIGSRQRALMNLLHQASHGLLFRTRALNQAVGNLLLGLPLLLTVWSYAAEHGRHHGWLWDDDRDPKTRRYRTLGLVRPPEERTFWQRHVLRPLVLAHVPFNVRSALWKRGDRLRDTLARAGFWVAVLTAVVAAHATLDFALLWVVPYLTSFQVIRYWTEMAEHGGLKTTDPWLGTRTWRSWPPVLWLLAPHNDELHLTHHLFPSIPHYRIRAAHRLLLAVPEYAAGHHCDGFFRPRRPDAPSVVQDVLHPERIHEHGSRDPVVSRQSA